MRYYAKFHDGSQTKNKAQASVLEFMRKFGSTLVADDDALRKISDEMKEGVDFINSLNPRCTNIDVRIRFHNDFQGKSVFVGDICSYSFYPVNKEYFISGEQGVLKSVDLINLPKDSIAKDSADFLNF